MSDTNVPDTIDIRYFDEMTWRFNLRELGEGERVNSLLAQTAGRLRYKTLIA